MQSTDQKPKKSELQIAGNEEKLNTEKPKPGPDETIVYNGTWCSGHVVKKSYLKEKENEKAMKELDNLYPEHRPWLN